MFEPNGSASKTNGVVRFGDVVAGTRTLVLGVREYTAYVWGKRVPRTREALARAAYNELQEEVARMGDPSPLLVHERFLTEVRVALAAVSGELAAGQPEEAASRAEWFLDTVRTSLEAHDAILPTYRPRGPEYHAFLNRLVCALTEGLSPITADLLSFEEISELLNAVHYPGFWKDDSDEADQGKVPETETETTTETMNQTGST